VKKPQLILAGIGLSLVLLLFVFGRFVPEKEKLAKTENAAIPQASSFSIDSARSLAEKNLTGELNLSLKTLENKLKSAATPAAQLAAYHELAHFWSEEFRFFELYAWNEALAARLENSEKSLTFAARLFLDNLQEDSDGPRRQWKALQAKDLYERSLKINPNNDSTKVGLGACYLFGNISTNPMEGIALIREVVQRDSTNVYAQLTLVKASILSGQFDKGITRLQTVIKVEPKNIEAHLLLADLYERTGEKKEAVKWYEKSLQLIEQPEIRQAIKDRIGALKQ
jgi:tetratricopeptide (TPR) repeat protein